MNLPNYEDFWEITYDSGSVNNTYEEYYDAVDAQKLVDEPEPYRFGSYQIYKADKDTMDFQVSMFLNTTSA